MISVRVTRGLTIVLSSSNMLGIIGGRHGLDVVNAIRVIRVAVGLANGVSGVSNGGFVVVVLEIRYVWGDGVTRGVGSGCGIRGEALKADCTLWVDILWVTVEPDVTKVLLNRRSARESGVQSRHTWRDDGLLERVKVEDWRSCLAG